MKRYHSLSSIRTDLNAGVLTCAALLEDYLKRIEDGKNLNAFLETFADSARVKAAEVDKKIAAKTAGKLAGMVIALKDNIC